MRLSLANRAFKLRAHGRYVWMASVGLIVLALSALWWWLKLASWPDTLPQLAGKPANTLATTHSGAHRLFLDRHGQVLSLYKTPLRFEAATGKPPQGSGTQLTWLGLSEFGSHLPAALVASEDQRFWQHDGVDRRALLAAVWAQMTGRSRGGSTLTMQLARQLTPPGQIPRTWRGKLMQMQAAWALERQLSKAQILEAYLNLVPLRGDVRGLHTGAALWLGVQHPAQLDTAQRAWLLAMIPAPQARAEHLQARACRIFERQASAFARSLGCQRLLPQLSDVLPLAQSRLQALPKTVRQTAQDSETASFKRSSLDAAMQRSARAALAQLASEHAALGATDGAAVVLHNASGQVLAYTSLSLAQHTSTQSQWLGHSDWAQEPRQSGSILKPLLYAHALSTGALHAHSVLPAVTTSFAPFVKGEPAYRPRYNGHQIGRSVSPREALGGSLNIPAVHVLHKLGVPRFSHKLHELQLMKQETAYRAGLSLALGSAETQLLPLANAYRCLANAGQHSAITWSAAQIPLSSRMFTATAARQVTEFLSDPEPRNRAFGSFNSLNTPYPTAVKTGTSNQSRDSWAIGYSKEHTVGVWIGRRDRGSMREAYGPNGAGLVWRELMDAIHLQEQRALKTSPS